MKALQIQIAHVLNYLHFYCIYHVAYVLIQTLAATRNKALILFDMCAVTLSGERRCLLRLHV